MAEGVALGVEVSTLTAATGALIRRRGDRRALSVDLLALSWGSHVVLLGASVPPTRRLMSVT